MSYYDIAGDLTCRWPRGRTYVRNGSVVDLQVLSGEVQAIVSGSEIYKVAVKVSAVPKARWASICTDWASMCKHVAATLYGIGARLDARPELVFKLRKVDEKDLIAKADKGIPLAKKGPADDKVLGAEGLSELFGLELGSGDGRAASEAAAKTAAKGKKKPAKAKAKKKGKR